MAVVLVSLGEALVIAVVAVFAVGIFVLRKRCGT